MPGWRGDDLARLDAAQELEIAVARAYGSLRPWTTVWVVLADGEAYLRTWQRRQTGWFGRVLRSRRGRIRVPGLEADVDVVDVGERMLAAPAAADRELAATVDDAVRAKYGTPGDVGVSGMVTNGARTTTLRLTPR